MKLSKSLSSGILASVLALGGGARRRNHTCSSCNMELQFAHQWRVLYTLGF